MHFFDMCRTERRRLFNISICGKTILIAVCVLAMGVLTFINENPNIEMTDKYFYELFRLYFSRGTFFQLLFVPVGYYIMYGICTDLKEKMSYFFVTRSNINAYIAAKFVVGILYAFVMFELIFNIFCICGTNIFKIVDYSDYSCGSDVYEDVLKINPYLYFELRIFIASLIMSLFVGVGMFVTVFFGSRYIGALSAFLAYIIIVKINHNSVNNGNGHVRHSGTGATTIGSNLKENSNLQIISNLLEESGFAVEISDDIQRIIWSKLFVNLSINTFTAITRSPIRSMIDNHYAWDFAEKMICEAVDVAEADGTHFSYMEVLNMVHHVCEDAGKGYSSMSQDVMNCRKTEIDAINGAIVEQAKLYNVAAPYNRLIVDLIHAIEES